MENLFEKFLNDISYKFTKGYPDMNNEQDILILENELNKLGFSLNENDFNVLTFFELKKRGGYRFKDLVTKIDEKLPFSLVGGESTPLQFIDPKYREIFSTQNPESIKQLTKGGNVNTFSLFKDDAGKQYSISDLVKDSYFGGKGKGSGTKVEDANLQILNTQISRLVQENGGPITIKVGNDIYPNIVKAESQFGVPKSDFNLIDSTGKAVVFISHKKSGGKGPSANDFIRWSGYTMYENHPEVKAFNQALIKWINKNNPNEGLPRATRFVSPIKDPELIRKLIYGPKYGGNFNKDNVTIILQGKIILDPIGDDIFNLTSEHDLLPPELPKGEYVPYLTAGYRGDRQMFGIKHNEAIVMTKAIALASSNVYELRENEFEKIK
jgi:hypothetical protein